MSKQAILLYTCEAQSEWKDWMERVWLDKGKYKDPFVGVAGHMSADVSSMPRSNEATALMIAARNRRRPRRKGWRYQEDYHQFTFDEADNAFNNSEPIYMSGECFRAGSSLITPRFALSRSIS